MIQKLRENKNHGTKEYPYCQYNIANVSCKFHIPIHWHDEMEIIYVRQGRLLVHIEEEEYILTPGQVLIVNACQLHLMVVDDMSVDYDTLLFSLELISFQADDLLERTVFRPLRNGQLIFPNRVCEQVLTAENLALLEEIVAINKQKRNLYQMETRVLLLRFLLEVLRNTTLIKTSNTGDDIQRQMLEYIRQHYKEGVSLEDLSEEFHLSSKYLSRYFKEKFHLTFSEYVDHLRMSHAKELLENTDMSITEIALECGFSGVSFFIRRFTGKNGCSPLKWRKQLKE